jgi:thiol-disulfide isomerase/thioredoxin
MVVFACNHCPYVIHLADALGDFAREIALQGVGTVAINSNDLERYPQDGPELMKSFSVARHWDFPYLLDESQEVAKAYGAACTPDFFLFDAEGKLFYAGQFDDSRPRSGVEPHAGDLREAVRRMLGGEAPLVRPYPSSGCNIKWKPGNEPSARLP